MSDQPTAATEQAAQSDTGAATVTGPEATAAPAGQPAGRVFVYNGQEYPDPDPALTAEQVRRELARFVPELTNADVREERRADGTAQFTFSRRLGTKGSGTLTVLAAGAPPVPQPGATDSGEDQTERPNACLAALIGAIPESRLEIFRLAHELVLPNGEFDLDAAAARGEELERASEEAHRHARDTASLRDTLLALSSR
jgi:PRTRC genetic system protein C